MSSVLHPVGPEPGQTYWIRRALVLGVALLLVLGVVLAATRSGSASSASAVPPPAVGPAANPSRTPAATSTVGASPSPTATKSSRAPTTTKTTTPKPQRGAKAKPAGPVKCAPAGLRTTLTGQERLKPQQPAAFKLSLINGTGTTCVVSVRPADFSVTIYSGRDRIWTSDHCARTVPTIKKTVAAEDAVEWSMTWNGRRSADGCKSRSEIPRAGTYLATAHLDGAAAVRLRMILRH